MHHRNFIPDNIDNVVNVPFQMYISPGESSFTIPVPRHYDTVYHGGNHEIPKRRAFHFSQLCMTPAYYSQKAALLDMDSRGELETQINFTIRASFTAHPGLYRTDGLSTEPELRWEQRGGEIHTIIKSFNEFFETQSKPAGFKSTPCFIDWIDSRWDLPSDLMYYQTSMEFNELVAPYEIDYYGTDDADVGGALEESARDLWNANNYAFPFNAITDDVFLQNFRLRLHIAPNTIVQFSSNILLQLLGFSPLQIGQRRQYNRYYIENPHKDLYNVVLADNAPRKATIFATGNKVNVAIYDKMWVSNTFSSNMQLSKFRKDEEMKNVLIDMLEDLTRDTNVEFGLEFDETARKFEFTFPDNPNLDVTLHVPKDLSNRLGYGAGVQKLTRASRSEALQDASKIENAENMAKTLVYDTGMVIVTHDSLGSMSTLGTSELFMGCLWPTVDGTILLKRTADVPPSVHLPSSGVTLAHMLFNIWVYNDDGSTRKFEWKTGLYLAGILQGTTASRLDPQRL